MNAADELISENSVAVITEELIKDKIYCIRGQQIMLDFELAEIYGYTTSRFNEQVKNNIGKFDIDFMFQLTKEEFENLISKKSTSSWGGRRKLPYAFTEQGIYMLMTVLKGEIATAQSKSLIRIFKKMKDYISNNSLLIGDKPLQELAVQLVRNTNEIAEIKNDMVRKSELPEIIRSFGFSKAECEYLILNGETTEAALAYRKIYSFAKSSVYIIDNYINLRTLHLLNDIADGVSVTVFSDNVGNKLRLDEYKNFIREYPYINIELKKVNNTIHDRYIVIDYNKSTEQLYHCGASSKDAGNKVTTISKLSDNYIYHSMIDKLKDNILLELN